jgi:hypothetical protein
MPEAFCLSVSPRLPLGLVPHNRERSLDLGFSEGILERYHQLATAVSFPVLSYSLLTAIFHFITIYNLVQKTALLNEHYIHSKHIMFLSELFLIFSRGFL